MAASISQLAPELLHLIFSRLDLHSLKESRLVQQKWVHICDEYLLPEVHIRDGSSLTWLLDIAQNKTIAGHVRSITCTSNFSGDPIHNAKQSESPQRDNVYMSRIRNTVLFFSRLEKIVVSDGGQFLTHTITQRDEYCTTAPVSRGSCLQQLQVLQAGLADTSIHLNELHAEWLDTIFFLKAPAISEVWRSLTVLVLGIVQNQDMHGVDDLKLVLLELTGLRQLHISSSEDFQMRLESIIDGREVPWSCLTNLSLRGFIVTESTLRRLFQILTLEDIGLAFIGLVSEGCWRRVLEGLHRHNLKRVSLSGWLINITTRRGWVHDTHPGRTLFREVEQWLKEDCEETICLRKCPLYDTCIVEF
jgi:hypothetical protein